MALKSKSDEFTIMKREFARFVLAISWLCAVYWLLISLNFMTGALFKCGYWVCDLLETVAVWLLIPSLILSFLLIVTALGRSLFGSPPNKWELISLVVVIVSIAYSISSFPVN